MSTIVSAEKAQNVCTLGSEPEVCNRYPNLPKVWKKPPHFSTKISSMAQLINTLIVSQRKPLQLETAGCEGFL